MKGKTTPKEIRREVKHLYCAGYPVEIIALRTHVAKSTIKNWASKEKWYASLRPSLTLDDILEDFRTILSHTRGRLLEKTIENEFDDQYSLLIDKARQLVFIVESLMKQAPYDSAKQSREILEKAKGLIQQSEEYTQEQKDLVCDALLGVQTELIQHVVNTMEKLT